MNFQRSFLTTSVIFLSASVHAGSVLVLETVEFGASPPILGTVEVSTSGKSSRIEIESISSHESGGVIFSGDKDEMIAIDHNMQEYFVIDQAMMTQMANQVEVAMKQMEEALAAMPPEERAEAEKMMQQQMPRQAAPEGPPTKLKKTGKSDSVAGYDCEYYDVIQADRTIRELCVTGWDELPGGIETAGALMELSDFFEEMRKAFKSAGGMDVMDRQREMFEYMEELNGYPVLSREFGPAGDIKEETRLQSSTNTEVSQTMFEPPHGYQNQAMQ